MVAVYDAVIPEKGKPLFIIATKDYDQMMSMAYTISRTNQLGYEVVHPQEIYENLGH